MKGFRNFLVLILLLLLFGTLSFASSPKPTFAGGSVYIRCDGTIEPSSAPVKRNGDIYTMEGDIFGSIVIEKSNITLNGANHLLRGTKDGLGVTLNLTTNVRLENLRVEGFNVGFMLDSAQNCIISENLLKTNLFGVFLESSSNNVIDRNIIEDAMRGVWLDGFNCSNNAILKNNIERNIEGIVFTDFADHNLVSSNFLENTKENIRLLIASYNVIANNTIASSGCGIELYISWNNTILGNQIIDNGCGVKLSKDSHGNHFFHNVFVGNAQHVRDVYGVYSNTWDDGYSSGGNYWSDYSDTDHYSGACQNILGSDKIWDKKYVITPEVNQDNYPLVRPFGLGSL